MSTVENFNTLVNYLNKYSVKFDLVDNTIYMPSYAAPRTSVSRGSYGGLCLKAHANRTPNGKTKKLATGETATALFTRLDPVDAEQEFGRMEVKCTLQAYDPPESKKMKSFYHQEVLCFTEF